MKQINEATKLAQSRNGEQIQFHKNVLDVVTEEFAAAQKIDALWAAYKELYDKEDTAFIQSRALAGTADVEAKDAVRDELTRYVCSIVDAKQLSPEAGEKAAANLNEYDRLLLEEKSAITNLFTIKFRNFVAIF